MKLRSFALLLGTAFLASCGDRAVQSITGPIASARVKFFNFGVNAPGVNFYAGTAKMTAISSATSVEAVTGVTYGSVGGGGFYSAIAPGTYDLKATIAATIDKDLVVSTVNATIADGKHYSFFTSGFYNVTTKNVEGFVIEDAFPAAFDYTKAYVRFVNGISNSSPMTLYAKSTAVGGVETAVGGLVAYKNGGAFTALSQDVYDLSTRVAGSATNAISRTAVSFVAGRVYTIGARGDITVVSTTATNRPFLDNTLNR